MDDDIFSPIKSDDAEFSLHPLINLSPQHEFAATSREAISSDCSATLPLTFSDLDVQSPASSDQSVFLPSATSVRDDDCEYRIIVIFSQGTKIGMATYSHFLNEIQIGEFPLPHSDEAPVVLRMIATEINPTILAVNKSAPSKLCQALMSGRDETCTLLRRKGSDFEASLAETRLAMLTPASMPSDLLHEARHKEKLSYLMCRFDLYRKPLALRALGCMVTLLLEKRIVNELEDPNTPIPITSFRLLSHDQLMMVDETSFLALQIFKADTSPSIHGLGAKKEGMSLFALLDQTKSTGGKRLLRKWMMYPSQDLSLLEDRLASVAFMKSPRVVHHIPQLQQAIRQVADLPKIMMRLQTFMVSASDWEHLSQSLVNCLKVQQILLSLCNNPDGDPSQFDLGLPSTVRDLNDFRSSQELFQVAGIIHGTVDSEKSRQEGRVVVKSGVNDRLDQLRETFEGFDDFLHSMGIRQLQAYAPQIKALKCVYYPQKGFALAIPAEDALCLSDPKLTFIFRTHQYYYFKDDLMTRIDQEIGDIYCDMIDIEKDLIRQLNEFTIRHVDRMLELHDLIAFVDCALALGLVANQYGWCRPKLHPSGFNMLSIVESRHPLLEFCSTQLIVNDVDFASERVKILTGPNGSGKSVFIKQVALNVYMAQIGSFVPAQAATISLVDRIFTRVAMRESISIPQGSFMLDLCQIADILNHSTSSSLVIIDEFGKGTHEADGRALLIATINDLLEHHRPPPRTLIATHMSEIFQTNMLYQGAPPNSYSHFSMAYHLAKGFDEPVYLFKVVRGSEGSSLATSVARAAGLPESLISRAEQILSEPCISSIPELAQTSPFDQVVQEFFKIKFNEIENLDRFKQYVLSLF